MGGRVADRAQCHGRDDRADVRLEQVRTHAGHVADVVTDVVGDGARVAGVVLGDARFDFADEVGTDVSGLREDAAADACEERDRAGAEGEAQDLVQVLSSDRIATVDHREDRDAEQAEAHDAHAHHGARSERDRQRVLQRLGSRLRRADRSARRRVHADPAREAGRQGARDERDGRLGTEAVEFAGGGDRSAHHDDEDRQPLVLSFQEGGGAVLDLLADVDHLLAALVPAHDLLVLEEREDEGGQGGADGDVECGVGHLCGDERSLRSGKSETLRLGELEVGHGAEWRCPGNGADPSSDPPTAPGQAGSAAVLGLGF